MVIDKQRTEKRAGIHEILLQSFKLNLSEAKCIAQEEISQKGPMNNFLKLQYVNNMTRKSSIEYT